MAESDVHGMMMRLVAIIAIVLVLLPHAHVSEIDVEGDLGPSIFLGGCCIARSTGMRVLRVRGGGRKVNKNSTTLATKLYKEQQVCNEMRDGTI